MYIYIPSYTSVHIHRHVHVNIHMYIHIYICIYAYIGDLFVIVNIPVALSPSVHWSDPVNPMIADPLAQDYFNLQRLVLLSLFFHGWNVLVIY
jgi:hypothetical protein